MGDARRLGDHARGLDPQLYVPRLLRSQITEIAVARRVHDGPEMRLAVKPTRGDLGDAVISDRVPVDEPGAAGTVEHLAQLVVTGLGLVDRTARHQPVEDLAQRDWKMIGVLGEHG